MHTAEFYQDQIGMAIRQARGAYIAETQGPEAIDAMVIVRDGERVPSGSVIDDALTKIGLAVALLVSCHKDKSSISSDY